MKAPLKMETCMDIRIRELANTIVNYACSIKKGDKVMIDALGESSKPLIKALIKAISEVGAVSTIKITDPSIQRECLLAMTEEMAEHWFEHDYERLQRTDVYIMIKSLDNQSELSDIPEEKLRIYGKAYLEKINAHIVNKTNWISLRYPNAAMAQLANMSLEAYEDYFYSVCNMDYGQMSKAMDYLVKLMERTDKVRIVGAGTDVSFSIKGIPVHKCDGKINLPDGEVYTAPLRTSVNGRISFNVPSIYQGTHFENIKLEFKDGKIMSAESNNTEKLKKILDTDAGSRYIGEFALGVNSKITKPMKDILFDEKIGGSFHLTPGFSYENASNGNTSSVHWDMVCIQTEAYGGEIYFDDQLVRKNGKFLAEELKVLNG